ncbi:MAG: PD-(D/E)XK motif protein [Acidobacteriota bacterium]
MNNPWNSISPPAADFNALRVDSSHPFDLFWALNEAGHYLLVYEFQTSDFPSSRQLPKLSGLDLESRKLDEGGGMIILTLRDRQNWELFYSLCSDLVQATRHSEAQDVAIATFVRRLHRWQDFLKRGKPDMLAEEKIKGLLGELLFLRNHLIRDFDASAAVEFWKGPEGFPQDFNVNKIAIEVKCQSGGSTPTVRISSADQLASQLPQTFLHVITLARADAHEQTATNLPTIVAELRTAIESVSSKSLERFNDLLLLAGYMDSEEYLDFNYLQIAEECFEVRAGFPRIQSSDLLPGVERVSYSIRLSACRPFKGQPDWGRHKA